MTITAPLLNAAPTRLMSIDAYRGFVMLLMMAEVLELKKVSDAFPDSQFWKKLAWQQTHVPWAGCTLHDLIQPSFSFLVGVAVPFSIASRIAKGQSQTIMCLHTVWRAFLLIALGIFLRSVGKNQTNFTFDDTLTQIGLGYVPLFLLGLTRERVQWFAVAAIVIAYWLAFVSFSPPHGFTPDIVGVKPDWQYNYHGLAAHWNLNTNLAWAVDQWWLNLFPRDPKLGPFVAHPGGYATLSFIPTLATMILGLIAGNWLRRDWTPARIIGWLVTTGVVLLSLGLIAHETELCPCVKRIWTSSWVLYSGGWCFLILAGFYFVIDVADFRSWSFPLRVVGMNSIAAYVLAHGFDKYVHHALQVHFRPSMWQQVARPLHLTNPLDDLIAAFTPYEPVISGGIVLLVLWLVLLWMERRRIFLKI